jgi:hypothetical protein
MLEDAQEHNLYLYETDVSERNNMKIINKFINRNVEVV